MGRDEPWQIAADLEAAAKAVKELEWAITRCDESVWSEINALPAMATVDFDLAAQLQALSDKYQAIADAEPEPGSNEWLKQSPQFHPGDIA